MSIPKKLLFFIPVAAGLLLFLIITKNKQEPVRPELTETSRSVNVIETRAMTIIPTAVGYGYVQPKESWDAIPEVGGRVVEVHPELHKGTFVAKGDLLIKIDTQSYGLAESRGEASVMSIEAQLKELEQQRINNEKLLETEQKALQLTIQELERKQQLYEKGYISESDLEQEEKKLLTQQTSVDNLINALELIPSQEKALLAQKKSDVSSLSESRLNLEKTVIKAPFDCRISAVNIELNQYAPAGVALLSAYNVAEVEIPVQLSPEMFIKLISVPEGIASPTTMRNFDMDKVRELIGLSALVRLPLFTGEAEWEGVFQRTGEAMDLATGAIPVYIAVKDPFGQIIPGKRPPLIPNMYTEVELQGKVRNNKIVIPFSAVHDGAIYIVDKQKRLARKEIKIEMIMGNMAVIEGGVEENTQIITTDLVPAIEGMLVTPILDKELTEKINELEYKI